MAGKRRQSSGAAPEGKKAKLTSVADTYLRKTLHWDEIDIAFVEPFVAGVISQKPISLPTIPANLKERLNHERILGGLFELNFLEFRDEAASKRLVSWLIDAGLEVAAQLLVSASIGNHRVNSVVPAFVSCLEEKPDRADYILLVLSKGLVNASLCHARGLFGRCQTKQAQFIRLVIDKLEGIADPAVGVRLQSSEMVHLLQLAVLGFAVPQREVSMDDELHNQAFWTLIKSNLKQFPIQLPDDQSTKVSQQPQFNFFDSRSSIAPDVEEFEIKVV